MLLFATTASAGDHPLNYADNAVMVLSGTVTGTNDEGFVLDYGSGTISVDMDAFDDHRLKADKLDGQRVTVLGEVDDDFFERTELEAMSISIDNHYTHLHATSGAHTVVHSWSVPEQISKDSIELRGTVAKVGKDSFQMKVGARMIEVDVDDLGYDPMDELGWQKIDVGDVVRVVGEMDARLFKDRVLDADRVTTVFDKS
jgi:uncharacterized protein YdeI (BOF family)